MQKPDKDDYFVAKATGPDGEIEYRARRVIFSMGLAGGGGTYLPPLAQVRRTEIPRHNSLRWMEFPGMQERFHNLPDAEKWEFPLFNGGLPQPPTQISVWRAFWHDNFSLVKDVRWASAEVRTTDE